MLKNHFKIALRNILKHKSSTFINVIGLAIGMACCITVAFFVHNEGSYDNYHENKENLYRLSVHALEVSSDRDQFWASSSVLWAPALKRDFPEIASFTRFVRLPSESNPWKLSLNNQSFFESDIIYTDPATLELFSWPMLKGNAVTALSKPKSMVLTEEMANKYFGAQNPIGQTIEIDPGWRNDDGSPSGDRFEYTITGVLQDIPHRSHFTFDFLLPANDLNEIYGGDINTGTEMRDWFWRGLTAYTYLLFEKNADITLFEEKFTGFMDRYLGDATRSRGYYFESHLQRIDKIYLDGNISGQLEDVGDRTYSYMFSIIALLILIIAAINYMNLATAKSIVRAREVGLRKVLGANRSQLISQFLSESVLVSLIAFVIGLVLAWLILPILYSYLSRELIINYTQEAFFLASLLAIGVLVGIASGTYPAFFLSRFKPMQVIKGISAKSGAASFLRKGLVVFQFAVSFLLITATITVFRQLEFMRKYDLGFNQEQIVVLTNKDNKLGPHYSALREELLSNPEIQDITVSSGLPGLGGGGDSYGERGVSAENSVSLGEFFVDYNFVDFLELELVAGRDFSREIGKSAAVQDTAKQTEVSIILNEEAVKRFGWSSAEEALTKQIVKDPMSVDFVANVVGVVKDFHAESLQNTIRPRALILLSGNRLLSIKLKPNNIQAGIVAIEREVSKFVPDYEFEYNFLDETFQEQYEEEARLGEIFTYISILAIFVACLGLFGLATFTTTQRFKEIGIRKTLGASVSSVVFMLSKDFTKLVLLAIIIGVPLSYLGIEKWLKDFAYRVDGSIWTYVIASLFALGIALLTISYQTIKAAIANPLKSIRSD